MNTNEISLLAKINDTELNCLIDTGAKDNFINLKTAEKIGLNNFSDLEIKRKVRIANNEMETIDKKIDVEITFLQIPDISFNTTFYLMNGLPVDCNLGYQFLRENEVKIDFLKEEIKIANFKINY